jgi:hypothetical protein
LSSDSDVIQSLGGNGKGQQHPDFDTSSDEVNKNQSTVKKAPPLPLNPPNLSECVEKRPPGARINLIDESHFCS